jgi:hypothetical protein
MVKVGWWIRVRVRGSGVGGSFGKGFGKEFAGARYDGEKGVVLSSRSRFPFFFFFPFLSSVTFVSLSRITEPVAATVCPRLVSASPCLRLVSALPLPSPLPCLRFCTTVSLRLVSASKRLGPPCRRYRPGSTALPSSSCAVLNLIFVVLRQPATRTAQISL